MRHLLRSPYTGLVLTGVIATAALLLEPRLAVSQDIHFLLQILWIGVVGTALLTSALLPAVNTPGAAAPTSERMYDRDPIPELLDEDRLWLQTHPAWHGNEQV